jgi:hypothetical protein
MLVTLVLIHVRLPLQYCNEYHLASGCTNFYEIPISSLGTMPQKQNDFEVRVDRAAKKLFIFQLFWVEFFFINSSQSS